MRPMLTKTTLVLAAVCLASSVAAQAQSRHGRGGGIVVVPRGYIYAPFSYGYGPFWSYDPFWDPYYSYGGYSFGRSSAEVKTEVVPKQTEVFVDGYYAGTADDFDGIFKRLHTTPGGHSITLYLDGYRTVTQNIYVRPGSTFKIRDTMDKLAAGQVSAPPPIPARSLRPATTPPADTPHQG